MLKWYRDNVPIPEKDYEEASSCALDETCAALKIHLKPSHNQAQFKCEATSKTLTYKKSASTTLQVSVIHHFSKLKGKENGKADPVTSCRYFVKPGLF